MAFVHPQSCECAKSELDIFAIPPTQTSIETGGWVEYNPISSLADGTPIEFVVGGSGQDYVDLANTQLYVRAQILQADNTPIDNTNHVGPVNLWMHSLFSEIDIKLNDVLVTSTNNTYAYRAYMETILTYGPAAKESQLTAALYYKDVAGHLENGNPHDQAAANTGFKKRHAFVEDSAVVDMIGCIHSDLFFQDKYLPNDVTLRVRLVRQKDSFALMSSENGATYKVKIVDCRLFVRKAKLSASVFVAHAKALEHGNAKYPVRRVICKTFTVPRGNLDFSQENLFSGQLPTRLVIGCVDNDAYNGNYAKNPFNFKHYNLTQLKLYLDGQQQHIKPLEPNYGANQYITAYMSLFSGTGKQQKDEGNFIERRDFPGGYALYAYDLTPDLSEDDHFNLNRDGSLRVDMKFGVALVATINVIVYAEFENVIEIDRNKNVLFDYQN
jgi:hypothetical protein